MDRWIRKHIALPENCIPFYCDIATSVRPSVYEKVTLQFSHRLTSRDLEDPGNSCAPPGPTFVFATNQRVAEFHCAPTDRFAFAKWAVWNRYTDLPLGGSFEARKGVDGRSGVPPTCRAGLVSSQIRVGANQSIRAAVERISAGLEYSGGRCGRPHANPLSCEC
jgi:hypothetical protein